MCSLFNILYNFNSSFPYLPFLSIQHITFHHRTIGTFLFSTSSINYPYLCFLHFSVLYPTNRNRSNKYDILTFAFYSGQHSTFHHHTIKYDSLPLPEYDYPYLCFLFYTFQFFTPQYSTVLHLNMIFLIFS